MKGKYEGMNSGTEVQQIQMITNQILRRLKKAALAHTTVSCGCTVSTCESVREV